MALYQAFVRSDGNKEYEVSYYHNPARWGANRLPLDSPLRDISNWSQEIKYYNVNGTDVSDAIKQLPNTTGGIYVFYLKGENLSFFENYILYIGRCQYTDKQNIRKRAKEYFKDNRGLVSIMMELWKNNLYYRYFPDTDNDRIINNEVLLIRAILPAFNETIPDTIDIQNSVPAF